MKKFKVVLHKNTIEELRLKKEPEEKINENGFYFDSIEEALNFNYPYHKFDYSYIIIQYDFNSEPDENGLYPILADAYLWELKRDKFDE